MKKQINDDPYNKAFAKWLLVITIIGPVTLVSDYIIDVLIKDKMISTYYSILVSNWILIGGGLIWFMACFLIQGKFLFSKGKSKSAFICLLIFTVLAAIIGKSLVNGNLYKSLICYTKDLSYAEKSLYYEKVEKLNDIYKTESIAKGRNVTIWLKTENDTYQLMSNIVTEDTYNEFRKNFKKDDKVKIKYLPNSQFVVSVEALSE